jgi:hypothetical protein
MQGPQIGAYECDGGSNQQWLVGPGYVQNVGVVQCLTQSVFSSSNAAQIVINEFGTGELTFYGADVIDVCMGVCNV